MSEGSARATLPPLHLTAPQVVPERPKAPAAEVIGRRVGPKAEEATLRTQLALARKKQESLFEPLAALARFLGSRGRDVRLAAALAQEALEHRDDAELRREAAQWLEALGDFSAAAELLEKNTHPDAQAWTRIGVLRARAGDPAGASQAFKRAAALDPDDAMSLELRATLSCFAPEVMSQAEAAAAYVEAARRRRRAGALQGEMEDLHRAVEADPTSESAAGALAAALANRARAAAGEEVLRARAQAQGGSARLGAHLRRFEAALAAGDFLRALDAALSAELDAPPEGAATVEAELDSGFDDVLLRVGLFELLAARLEVAAERAHGAARTRVLEQIARLCAGPLAAPSRAARAHVQILASDPSREESLLALRAYATQERDMVPLVEGLVRAAAADGDLLGRLRCARVLAALAEDTLGNTKLARWGWSICASIEPEDVAAADALRRLGGPIENDAWKSTLDQELAAAPARSGGLGRFLLGLDLLAPEEREARAALAAAARARGDLVAAREIVRPLVTQESPSLRGLGVAWVNAALAGDGALVARAMVRTAELCTPAVSAIVFCEAAERFLRAGDRESARTTAERACQADPAAPRPVATLANVVLGARDRTAASALERAVATVFPKGAWCEELASALEDLGETDYCVAWTQRVVALRPGDRTATAKLLERVQRAGDAARLADTLVWALPQPQPAEALAPVIASGLRALTALDPGRAAVVARRALDVFGPSVHDLRAAVLEAATRAGDHALAATLEERWAEIFPEGAASAWVRVAHHRAALGDRDAEARALQRAVQAGASPLQFETQIEALDGKLQTGDAEIARLVLVAELETARRDLAAANRAWREAGGAMWDLADDREGAIAAWMRGARLVRGGFGTLGADLVRFGGAQLALAKLVELLEAEADSAAAGALAAEAARIALTLGEPARAFDLASLALVRNPLLTDALEVAEKGAVGCGRAQEMTRLYDAVAAKSLGRYGRRAAHYRGARFFEHRGEDALALRHASQAFLAVPSEGAPLVLLRRVAEKANDLRAAVRTIVEVAQTQSDPSLRAAWLVRAASMAGSTEADARLRVDVLLQAALLVPRMSTLSMLADAARALLSAAPDERDALVLRFGRAAKTLTKRLEGPDGARVALSFVALSISIFDDADGALSALDHALSADADVEEYALLGKWAPNLARGAEARALLDKLAKVLDEPYSNVGAFALRLLGAMAKEIGDMSFAAKFLMRAAEREPDDEDLLREADGMAQKSAVHADLERFERKVPKAKRAAAYRAFAIAERAEGRYETAASAFERLIQLLPEDQRAEAELQLREIYEAAGRVEELENRALREARDANLAPHVRAGRWDDVARVREQRGDVAGAAEALAEAAQLDGEALERWSALERVATLAGRADLRVRALREIEVRVKEDARPAVLRRLAHAYEELGDLSGIEAAWRRVLEITPDDEQADQEIEAVIGRAGDYERLAAHLARRAKRLAGVSELRETLRVVRLRRVAILEQRLGKTLEACKELEQLAQEWPDNESALRYLADLYERTSQHGRAATVWRHLAEIATDETTRTDLELRSAISAKRDGDLIRAAEWTRAILQRSPGNVDALSLLAELARASSDDHTLGAALAGLAASPLEDPIKRSGWLIEAAQAAARAGDAKGALERAQLAAKIAPDRAETQLFARGLEYRMRGPGTPDEARDTVRELARVHGPAVGDDAALLAFLWAEATDVFEPGAGLTVLEQARVRAGDHALISAGIAERLLARGDLQAAIEHLQIAVNGHLLGLRSRGKLALAGAEAAFGSGADFVGERMLAIAENEADTKELAAELRVRLQTGVPKPPPSLVLAEADEGETEEEAAPVARATDTTERSLREALAAGDVRAGDALANLLRGAPEQAAEVVRVRRAQVDLRPGEPRLLALLRKAALDDRNTTYARAIDHVLRAFDPGAGTVEPPPLAAQVEQPGMLSLLVKPALGPGGESLALVWEGAASAFARDPSSYGITGVERVQPGSTAIASRLFEVAIRLLDVNVVLFLRRTPSRESATGASEPRLQTALAMPRPSVALLSTPAALLTGEVKEEAPPTCYALGQAIAAALPQNALLLGLPEAQARAVWNAVVVSFGPTASARASVPESARYTTLFWTTIPGRLQRRIQQLLGTEAPAHDDLVRAAVQSTRRVGLFLAGDVGTAVRAVCLEPSVRRTPPASPDDLAKLCVDLPEIADLVRLAVSPEYADARWRVPPDGSSRVKLSSGGLRLK